MKENRKPKFNGVNRRYFMLWDNIIMLTYANIDVINIAVSGNIIIDHYYQLHLIKYTLRVYINNVEFY